MVETHLNPRGPALGVEVANINQIIAVTIETETVEGEIATGQRRCFRGTGDSVTTTMITTDVQWFCLITV